MFLNTFIPSFPQPVSEALLPPVAIQIAQLLIPDQLRDGLDLLLPKLAKVIQNLRNFALEYKDLPTLG